MREIVLDTETTGLDPKAGHRLVEIGAVELVNYVPTGREFHTYINPERPVPAEAFAVHGLGDDFLKSKPVFADIVEDFLNFIGSDPLVIHNAPFDLGFLSMELQKLGKPPLLPERVIDTIPLARARFPGARVNLDALCQRFGIYNQHRTKHGALVDASLLAVVYLELRGGRQPDFVISAPVPAVVLPSDADAAEPAAAVLHHNVSEEALVRHQQYAAQFSAWQRYLP